MSLYKVGETWYAYIKLNGQRVRRSAGTSDKKDAKRFHDELRANLWAVARKVGAGPSWNDACVEWLNAAPRSESDRYSLRALDYDDRPIHDCTRESFEEALSGKSAATFNRYRAIIQAILHQAGISIKIPLRKVKTGRLRFLTLEEWDALYAELPAHLKPLAAFSIATGLRQRNATHLTWQQVDLKRKVAWVHPDEAKSDKAIGIPLSDKAIQILRQQQSVMPDREGPSKEWVFPYEGRGRAAGAPIAKIKTAWQLAMERAGLGAFERKFDKAGNLVSKKWEGDVTWHTLRHTWASWHVMAGTPLEVLQKLGGWADLKMVLKYAHLAPEHLAGFANNAVPWDAKRARA